MIPTSQCATCDLREREREREREKLIFYHFIYRNYQDRQVDNTYIYIYRDTQRETGDDTDDGIVLATSEEGGGGRVKMRWKMQELGT